jgi:hypothetical protein
MKKPMSCSIRAILIVSWCGLVVSCRDSGPAPFSPQTEVVFRLTYETTRGVAPDSATAFLIAMDPVQEPVILTAHHVFWRALLADGTFSSAPMDALVNEVRLQSLADPTVVITTGPNIPIEGALVAGSTDVAAFLPPASLASQPLRLASDAPSPGDTVWLLAPLRAPPDPARVLHGASVLGSENDVLYYTFLDSDLAPSGDLHRREVERIHGDPEIPIARDSATVASAAMLFHLMYTSGAPLLDRRGHVVGLHWGVADRQTFEQMDVTCCPLPPPAVFVGASVPAVTIRRLLRDARP